MSGQRRLAAVLFADMVGYSQLSQTDEPAALRLVQEYLERFRPLIASGHGREVKTMGDGILVEFGSALDATLAAVELQRQLFERNRDQPAPKLELRVGIHLGDVVAEGPDLFGDTVNIAARIEPLAEASGVAISGTVLEQVGRKIPYSATRLERAFLKNIDTPISVYSLDLPWSGLPAARVTPFTDRTQELDLLRRAVAHGAKGHGTILAISGDSGVGKTRLAEETVREGERRGFRAVRARGFEDISAGPFSLWAEIARVVLRDAPSAMLYRASDQCARQVAQLLPEFSERLGPIPPDEPVSGAQAREQFRAGLARFLENIVRDGPLLVVLDDLQWADRESVEFLEYLGPRLASLRLVLLLTYRDVEMDSVQGATRILESLRVRRWMNEITLAPLSAEHTVELVKAALGQSPESPAFAVTLREMTGGNPLFVEELLRSFAEEGSLVRGSGGWRYEPSSKAKIPPTVRDVLRRRVDRLGPETSSLLAVASVLGNEFDFELLREVTGLEPDLLLTQTETALRARLLAEREVAPGRSVLRLSDEQVRDVLYNALSLARRRQLHSRAGEIQERLAGARVSERAGEVARHYLLGDRRADATRMFLLAGGRARVVYAGAEAIAAYEAAVKLSEEALRLGEEPARWGPLAAEAFAGLAAALYEAALFARGAEVCRRGADLLVAGFPSDSVRLLLAGAQATERTNDYAGAVRLLERAEQLLRRLRNDPPSPEWLEGWLDVQEELFECEYWLDDTAGRDRRLSAIRPLLDRGGLLADLPRLRYWEVRHAWRRDRTIDDTTLRLAEEGWAGGANPWWSDFMIGWVQFWYGNLAEARARLSSARADAERDHSLTMISRATAYLLGVARRSRDPAGVLALIEPTFAAAQRASLPEYGAFATANRAWLRCQQGLGSEVELLGQQALDVWERLPERYPVDWMALWPMIEVALLRSDLARARALARSLLNPSQQPMPPAVRNLLVTATGRSVNDTDCLEILRRSVDAARQAGFA